MRFTIRDVLWLMALVAMGFAFWRSERQWIVNNRELTQENVALREEARLAREESDKAWLAANDPFRRPDPLAGLWGKKPRLVEPRPAARNRP
jgi:hypothetical protein